MQSLTRRLLLNSFRVLDLCAMAFAFGLALVVQAGLANPGNPIVFLAVRIKLSNAILFGGFTVLWHAIFKLRGLYRSRLIGLVVSEWWEVAKAVSLGTIVLAGLAVVVPLKAVDRRFLVLFFVASLVGTILSRSLLRVAVGDVRRKGRSLRHLVIIGCGPRGARLGAEIWRRPELGYLLLGYIDDLPAPASALHGDPEKLLGGLKDVRSTLAQLEVDEIIICLPIRSQYETIAQIISSAAQMGITVRMPADFFDLRLARARLDHLDSIPIVTLAEAAPMSLGLLVKRGVDVTCASLALTLLAPVFLVIAIAIKLDSSGPVFFAQERIGLGRRRFRMWKFRSMVKDAEARLAELENLNEVKGAAFKMKDDPRVSRVGRLLRRLSLDELPQLFNVVTGEMSLVGPRPLPVRDVEKIPNGWQWRRFAMKPGITCLWQVNGRHKIDFDHWMELDIQYIDNWSPALDMEILAKTVPAVLRGTGAS
jgi:exopolysaccharide biosynthesis polyprenyl glycosylphosphotransferase